MPGTMEVWYSDPYLVNGQEFRPPFEYWSDHLNNKQVKVSYLDISAYQMFLFQIITLQPIAHL